MFVPPISKLILLFAFFALFFSGCGGESGGQKDTNEGAAFLVVDVPNNVDVKPFDWVDIDASASRIEGSSFDNEALTFSWTQISGQPVNWAEGFDASSAVASLLVPADGVADKIVLGLEVSAGNLVESVQVILNVSNCESNQGEVWSGCFAEGFGPFEAFEQSSEDSSFFHIAPQGDFHVQWDAVASNDGSVDVTWNANDANHLNDLNGWFGIAAYNTSGESYVDLSRFADGEISFDLRLEYSDNPQGTSPFIFKMECEWPCASAELPVTNLHTSYEWKTYRFPISQLINTGLDIQRVTYPFILQPNWFEQNQNVTVQIRNIKLSETYSPGEQMPGCPKAGNISYSLERAASPTADQQDAYQRITAAMDEAVRQYNCYTNLHKNIFVQYNPSVQTADGHTNGTIRFGARGSMHHVTAMHEISHVMGVGFDRFRALVVDGIFTGEKTTAIAREIAGNTTEVIKSDGTHFWPHGLNYISEGGTQQDLINHCRVVEAIVEDIN